MTISVVSDGQILKNGNVVVVNFLGATAQDYGVYVGSNASNMQLAFRFGQFIPNSTNLRYSDIQDPQVAGNQFAAKVDLQVGTAGVPVGQSIVQWDSQNGVKIVAKSGDHVPGTNGAIFNAFNMNATPPNPFGQSVNINPRINESGTVVFTATMTGSGVTTSNNAGIFVSDAAGLRIVARTGDQIDVGGGIFKTLANFQIKSVLPQDSGQSALSASNELAWLALFTDGTQAIIFTPVPEPSFYWIVMVIMAFVIYKSVTN